MNASVMPNYWPALDAATDFCPHFGCRWRGASEAERWPPQLLST
jgi:hypothetical protein